MLPGVHNSVFQIYHSQYNNFLFFLSHSLLKVLLVTLLFNVFVGFCVCSDCEGIPSGIQEDNGVKYEFKVYQANQSD